MTRNDEGPSPAACRSTGEGCSPRAPVGRAVNWDRSFTPRALAARAVLWQLSLGINIGFTIGISAGQHLFAVVTADTEHRIVIRSQLAIVDAGCPDGARLDGGAPHEASRFYRKGSSDRPAGLRWGFLALRLAAGPQPRVPSDRRPRQRRRAVLQPDRRDPTAVAKTRVRRRPCRRHRAR